MVIVAIAMLVAAPASARVADHNPIEVTDPGGDGTGAPDITRVTVANDLAGNILFVVEVGNRTGFAANDGVAIFIDADRSVQTGVAATGVDYLIGFDGGVPAVGLARWSGTTFEDAPSTTLRGGWAPGYAAVINRAELGNTTAFDFQVVSLLLEGEDIDVAPDTDFETYTVASPHIEAITPRFPVLRRAPERHFDSTAFNSSSRPTRLQLRRSSPAAPHWRGSESAAPVLVAAPSSWRRRRRANGSSSRSPPRPPGERPRPSLRTRSASARSRRLRAVEAVRKLPCP